MIPATQKIIPEALRPRVEGDFANDRVKQEIMAKLFEEPIAAAKIGRFTVIRELGRGGTGVVYAAYDEQLERKVAVKLLHADTSGPDGRARLLREAQAMARLSHPHIVSVHEVGTHGGQIYIAMEFVHGVTLGTWLKEQPRSWREIVEVFRQAGSGLAAAHEVGLVHRDFKPQNAMVGTDGRVRVLDFGLARADGSPELFADLERTADSQAHLHPLDTSLTLTGSLIGTPAFMAPEQFRGEKADPRCDQFALCVGLYEALYRTRPFAGDTIQTLMHSVLAGQVRDPGHAVKLPRALRAAILRGLALHPAHRHSSMMALLAAIDRVVEPRRRTWFTASLVTVGLFAGLGGVAYEKYEAGKVCDDRGAVEIADVWSPERSAAIGAVLREVDARADEAWPRAAARLDAYAEDWRRASVDACTASEIRRVQSPALYELRRACLTDRLQALRSTLDLFEKPESIIAIRAADLVAGLAPISDCADPHELQRHASAGADPQQTVLVAGLRAELARAEAMRRATLFTDALASIDALAPKIPADHGLLRAELELTRGRTYATMGRQKDAYAALQTAYFTALEAGQEPLAIAAATALVRLTGEGLADFAAAKRWTRHAQALLERGGSLALRADLASAQGSLDHHTGRYADAQGHFRRALDLYAQAGLQDTPEAAVIHRIYADVALTAGDIELAQQELSGALELLAHEYCNSHPELAAARNSSGVLALRRGDFDGAVVEFERGRKDLTGVVTEDHKVYMTLTINLAAAHLYHGELDLAAKLTRDTLAAVAQRSDGLPGSSLRLDPERYSLRLLMARILHQQGQLAEAEAEASALLTDAERAWGTDEPYVAGALSELADIVLAAGRPNDALTFAERAYKLADTHQKRVHPELRYNSGFVLARVLAESGQQPRAIVLAHEAQTLADSVGDRRVSKTISTWLAEHKLG